MSHSLVVFYPNERDQPVQVAVNAFGFIAEVGKDCIFGSDIKLVP